MTALEKRKPELEFIAYSREKCIFTFTYLSPLTPDEDQEDEINIEEDDLAKIMLDKGWMQDYNIATGEIITNETQIDHIFKFVYWMDKPTQEELFNLILKEANMYEINGIEYDLDIIGETLEELGWIIKYHHKSKSLKHDSMGFDPIQEQTIQEYLGELSDSELGNLEDNLFTSI